MTMLLRILLCSLAFAIPSRVFQGETPPTEIVNSAVISVANATQVEQQITLQGNTDWMSDIKFSPDGNLLAVVETGSPYNDFEGIQGKVRIWNITSWEEEIVLSTDGLSAMTIGFNSDGRYLAV